MKEIAGLKIWKQYPLMSPSASLSTLPKDNCQINRIKVCHQHHGYSSGYQNHTVKQLKSPFHKTTESRRPFCQKKTSTRAQGFQPAVQHKQKYLAAEETKIW